MICLTLTAFFEFPTKTAFLSRQLPTFFRQPA